jgi:threonine/homoserine/homoserine lactone efflux protein
LSLKGLLVINRQWLDTIKLFGCLYIGYLGLQILLEVIFKPADQAKNLLKPANGGFQQGFLVGISNPKDIIFFAAFFPQFIGITADLDLSLMILTLSWIVLDFLTLSMVYVAFHRLSHSRLYPHLLALCGMILIVIALYGISQILF